MLARAVPIVDWLPHYRRAWLSRDLIAGVTVWAVLVPESIAYASIAGVPAQYGLYTALGAATLFALFTGARQVITGPSGPIAAVAASVCTLVVAADSPQYLAAMVELCAATAIVYLLLGVFRMGWTPNFLASPVLEGFVFAFGLGLIGALKELPQTDLSTLAVGGTAVALLLVPRFLAPRLPRAIMVGVLGAIVVALFATLPEAVLGPIVIDAAVGLLHWRAPARFLAVGRRAFVVFVVTGVGLFFISVVAGVIVGVVLSLLLLISADTGSSPVPSMSNPLTRASGAKGGWLSGADQSVAGV